MTKLATSVLQVVAVFAGVGLVGIGLNLNVCTTTGIGLLAWALMPNNW